MCVQDVSLQHTRYLSLQRLLLEPQFYQITRHVIFGKLLSFSEILFLFPVD